jgi:hypothetical protein
MVSPDDVLLLFSLCVVCVPGLFRSSRKSESCHPLRDDKVRWTIEETGPGSLGCALSFFLWSIDDEEGGYL